MEGNIHKTYENGEELENTNNKNIKHSPNTIYKDLNIYTNYGPPPLVDNNNNYSMADNHNILPKRIVFIQLKIQLL